MSGGQPVDGHRRRDGAIGNGGKAVEHRAPGARTEVPLAHHGGRLTEGPPARVDELDAGAGVVTDEPRVDATGRPVLPSRVPGERQV